VAAAYHDYIEFIWVAHGKCLKNMGKGRAFYCKSTFADSLSLRYGLVQRSAKRYNYYYEMLRA